MSGRTLRDRSKIKNPTLLRDEDPDEKHRPQKRKLQNSVQSQSMPKSNKKPKLMATSQDFGIFPESIWKEILQHCQPQALLIIAQTCKTLHEIASFNMWWKTLYAQRWEIGYGANWDSNFLARSLQLTDTTGWKERYLDRMHLEPHRVEASHVKKVNWYGSNELSAILEGVSVYGRGMAFKQGEPFICIGPSTIPVLIRTEAQEHQGVNAWIFKASVFAPKTQLWYPMFEICANYRCEEDELYSYPLENTITHLLLGAPSSENWSYENPDYMFKVHFLRDLCAFCSNADESQLHHNTSRSKPKKCAADEEYE